MAARKHVNPPEAEAQVLRTTAGDFPLQQYHLRIGDRGWSLLHTDAILTYEDEVRYLEGPEERRPYGVVLWPAAIALAHDIAGRPEEFTGRTVLELGAGTGLPGIVAASAGARVVQTDRLQLPLGVCQRNGTRNGVAGIEYRLADWTEWDSSEQHDWILGSDILYSERLHPHLLHIFRSNLATGGRVLLADPFRAGSLPLLEALEAAGWGVVLTKWNIGEESTPRPIGTYELTPPAPAGE